MKESTAILYPNSQVAKKVTDYSEDHTLALPKELTDFHAWILDTQKEQANLTISTFQAKSLVWLARVIGAKHGTHSYPSPSEPTANRPPQSSRSDAFSASPPQSGPTPSDPVAL
jgi:hypothetical protein